MQKPHFGKDVNKELMDYLYEEDKCEKIKPCPFCGGKAKLNQAYDGHYCVTCELCGVRTLYSDKKHIPIMFWNRRK